MMVVESFVLHPHFIFVINENTIHAGGYTPANNVVFTCGNPTITLTLCPGTTSDIPKAKPNIVERVYTALLHYKAL